MTQDKEIELPYPEKSERSEKKKPTNACEYWKLTPSNKWRWKKKLKKNVTGEPEAIRDKTV